MSVMTAAPTESAPRWNLENIFPGGSSSTEYDEFVKGIIADLDRLDAEAKTLPRALTDDATPIWESWILDLQDLDSRLNLAGSFTHALTCQNVADTRAAALDAAAVELFSRWQILRSTLEAFSIKQDDAAWAKLVRGKQLNGVRFYLERMRWIAQTKMSEELEKLTLELAVDGYHSWNTLYEKMGGDLRVAVEKEGETRLISLGQNANRMSDEDRNVRRDAFKKMESAWESRADLAAMTLNAQAGFRLTVYRNRGWDTALQEPLLMCRMKRETLDAMWESVAAQSRRLKPYVAAKKAVLGFDDFCWYDQSAPVGVFDRTFSFKDAGDFIVAHLGTFSKEMAQFIRKGLDELWVEAEDRPGKRGGGWCTWMPLRKEPRIFMTYAPNYEGLSVLAHEFGHAFHGQVLRDEPSFSRGYPMTLAETASIFSELRVADAALSDAANDSEKLALLDQRLQSALIFFCNIRARYLFDCRFYAARAKGIVERAHLSEMMCEAQREAFCGMLADPDGLHPLFWASKLHFFITDMPFYNFPYTFGYLFANGVYDRAVREGPAFAARYRALLADTGRMTTEEVAEKHLGADLTSREFWDTAVARALSDIEPFLDLCREVSSEAAS